MYLYDTAEGCCTFWYGIDHLVDCLSDVITRTVTVATTATPTPAPGKFGSYLNHRDLFPVHFLLWSHFVLSVVIRYNYLKNNGIQNSQNGYAPWMATLHPGCYKTDSKIHISLGLRRNVALSGATIAVRFQPHLRQLPLQQLWPHRLWVIGEIHYLHFNVGNSLCFISHALFSDIKPLLKLD